MRIGIFNDSIDNYTFEIIDNIEKIDESYDLILININDIDKIEYIQKNAKCEIVVIVENDFYHNLIENELISAIINKNDVDDLNDWLQYFEAKTHKIQNLLRVEQLKNTDSIQDAVSFLLGIKVLNGLSIGYAYDLPASKIITASHGSHELFLSYEFGLSFGKKDKKYKSVRIL